MKPMKPSRCGVVGCADPHRSVHNVPASKDTRAKWIEFIFEGSAPERIGKSLLVCANHFELDCFTNLGQYNSGLATRLTLQAGSVPSIRRSTDGGIITEGTDGQSMEAVSEPPASVDVGDPERVCEASSRPCERAEKENPVVGEKEGERNESQPEEPEIKDTGLVLGCEPGSSSDSEKEDGVEVKAEEEFETNEERVAIKDGCSEDGPAGPDASEDADMHETTCEALAITEDTETKESVNAEADVCMLRVCAAADLDEMMDIGTVDQVEQEAQMKEEQQPNEMDTDNSRSPSPVNRASTMEDSYSVEEGADVKPAVWPPPAEEEEELSGDVEEAPDTAQSGLFQSSKATATSGRDRSSPAAALNGMKIVKLSIPRLETVNKSIQAVKSSPSTPLVKVKDEPIDEEYEQALIPSAFAASVKDEPNTAKEGLRIGSVFSVPPAAETQRLPIFYPSSQHMSCSSCKKSLMKGQTAFQRKGSPALFCSTTCLTTSLPVTRGATKICYRCQKFITRPQDVILVPDAKGIMREFCSQNCLNSSNYRKNISNFRISAATKKPPQPISPQSLCSMCTKYCISKHEVILSGSIHKICSDTCFNRFRVVNKLSMAGCANCGSYCHSRPLMLKMEDCNKTLCNAECLARYKANTKITKPCTMCRSTRLLAEMVDNKNDDDSVNLFCSSSCVMAFKVQTVSASGALLNCDSCEKISVPAYHLAMSDTSIRNFCTLPCVMAFQEKFKKSQKQVNVFTKLPVGSTQVQTGPPIQTPQDVPKGPLKLNCSQCDHNISFKPELLQIKDKLVFFCGGSCAHEYKKDNFVTSLCEYCKIEKMTGDAKRVNNRDCFFCSDGCKLLFRHEMSKKWGKHCLSCIYCHGMSKKLVTAQYGGSTEEFCSDECRSKYTMLFCHVAKCDTCGLKGKLKQSLPLMGGVKHFCNLSCLLRFCCDTVATQGRVVMGPEETTPVIANVISLAGPQTQKSSASERDAQQQDTNAGTVFQSQNSAHIGIQTDAVSVHLPKILKNKAVLCRPLVQNKGVTCKTQTADVEAQTEDVYPQIMVVPVPVPVYVPVPMNMYSQYTPKSLGLPLPVPVPMFLPVSTDSAERIMETIQEIKQKIPSDPFEAELILMAEMVAEEHEKNDKEGPKEKGMEKEGERQEAAASDDQASNFCDDLDTEELASFLNNWEDGTSEAGLRSPGRPCGLEKLHAVLDIPTVATNPPSSEPVAPAPTPMDVEADFAVETLERMARLREQSQRSPSPPPAAPRRRQAHRKAREKRGRKSQRSLKAAESSTQKGASNKAVAVDIPKLKSQYGVDAWKRWIQWRQTQPDLEKPRFGSRPIELKEDVLRCTTAELSYGLCCFIAEVKRPNGEPYSPDSLFYLCLGIQQYLFENGRVENIFMDRFYNKFSTEINDMLRDFKPSVTASGYIHSRVEEEFLWDCKQLGAYSPIVLLNTLLFFCCKYFGFTKAEQHRQLSFAHVMRCTKTNPNNTKTTFLRFYPPIPANEPEKDPEVPVKKRKEEGKEDILEMMENTENPLRCPVRLYEFYLSKCSESVKQRTNLFYLHPERCCVPNSPLWFSSTPLNDTTMEGMLVRILTVRELHLGKRKAEGTEPRTSEDSPFIPTDEEEEGDSE
uniref:zinc finger MYM-type protein 4 isoform X1 n=2 Tax=Gasterosteus aculeatus aculeatus TaxID=481459 RepID=UPI001A99422E|nr:zinc finger MYM-type protein 4 isoform X1 [Gasterosteus aculeatus aculeatus]